VTTKSTGDLVLRNAAFVPDDPGCDTTTGACAPPPDCVGVTCSEIIDHLVDAIDDTNHTAVNKAVGGTVLTNDVGIGITVTSNTAPSHGTVTMKPDGTYTYTPASGWSGPDSFTYTITDQYGNTDTATVRIVIDPLAVNDSAVTTVNKPVTSGVLPNDLGTGLTVTGNSQPSHGTVTMKPDGTYTYTPSPDFSGPDSFTYTITDVDGQTSTATVNIVINPQAIDDHNSTHIDEPVDGRVLPNDIGTGLNVTSNTQPSHGTVTMHPDGTYTYTPTKGWSGPDSFTYTITDVDGQTSTATVYLNVGLKANDDQNRTIVEKPKDGTTLINDEGTSLKVTNYTQPTHGKVVVNPDGTYTYTPEKGWSGPDSFTYTVTDPFGQTATATVWIIIDPQAYNDSASTTVNVPARGSLLSNDDGTGLVVTSHTQPSHGTVTVNPDGTYVYIPAPGFTGTDTFTYTITDVDGQTSTAVFTVVVTGPAPPPPVAPTGGSVGSARVSGLAVAGVGLLAGATILIMAAKRRVVPVR